MEYVKITTNVPRSHADTVRQAIGDAGAGVIGDYSYCSFTITGKRRFLPSKSAQPFIGKAGTPEVVEEEHIEVVCQRSEAEKVITALRQAHPYQEVALEISALINEEDL